MGKGKGRISSGGYLGGYLRIFTSSNICSLHLANPLLLVLTLRKLFNKTFWRSSLLHFLQILPISHPDFILSLLKLQGFGSPPLHPFWEFGERGDDFGPPASGIRGFAEFGEEGEDLGYVFALPGWDSGIRV